MMNLAESTGESSCKRQENGDVSSLPERPLKKARFAWQVKGKYHLKNDIVDTDVNTKLSSTQINSAGSSTKQDQCDNDSVGNTEQNLEILGDYLLKQDFNTLDSVITNSDNSILENNNDYCSETIEYPRYVSSSERSANYHDIDHDHETLAIPMSWSQIYNEDQCIARWQARQMAKGFVDNTINRVLDSWMVAPLPAVIDDNRFLALDVAEFINNLPGDNTIENEGILMAISAHGLQNTSTSSNSNDNSSDQTGPSDLKENIFLSPPCSPLITEEDIIQEQLKAQQNNGCSTSEIDMSWPYGDELRQNGASLALFPEVSSSSYLYSNENDSITNQLEYGGDNQSSDGNNVFSSHFDFLDTAVSFAIKNKGLTSFGTDYG